ncbi:argininosuccinate lyase [bacterium]|nr:argininosuccinate lyase [bacterium]
MWEGRFEKGVEEKIIEFTSSLDVDKNLALYDIKGSIAHAKTLAKSGILNKKEEKKIVGTLKKIGEEIKEGKFKFCSTDEDIHTAIERRLTEIAGKVAEKLHTARSRNDQIVLDEKLYLKDEIKKITHLIRKLQKAFLKKAEEYFPYVMSAYTHLQQSQPVLISHYFLSYIEMLERDRKRFEDAYRRIDVLPSGSGACCGTSIPYDAEYMANLLGFTKISRNSMDAVSDRDFILEVASISTICMLHLSRFSEDVILWNTQEFNYIILPDRFCTGSSIMPHKKNPDVFELIRGKSAISIGLMSGLFNLMKSLPLSYNRDLQEDKKSLFEILYILLSSLSILLLVVPEIKFNLEEINKKISDFTLSTDIAEYLVKKGVPFREAHKICGGIVKYCLKNNKTIKELDFEELKKFSDKFSKDVINLLNIEKSVNLKNSKGGTSSYQVKNEIKRWKRILK